MKTVLCFGDSNTWGYDPDASFGSSFPLRHPYDVRWTGVLARELGAGWRVVEEGQNGRTTVFEDPLVPHRRGRDYLPAALESHKPLDAVVLMLGTNDLKAVFSAPATQIAEGAGVLAKMILGSDAGPLAQAPHSPRPPKLLLIAPAAVGPFALLPDLDEKFAGAEARRSASRCSTAASPTRSAAPSERTGPRPAQPQGRHPLRRRQPPRARPRDRRGGCGIAVRARMYRAMRCE